MAAFANPTFLVCLPLGIIGIVVGMSFLSAGNSLRAVVNTQGNDIPHVMEAIAKLGGAFYTQSIVTLVGVVVGILLMFAVLFLLAASATSR